MKDEEIKEFQHFKSLFLKLMGSSELAPAEVFKKEALDKAAKQFRKMEAQRGEWVAESDLGKYIKDAGWSAGKFIREEFAFSAWIKDGHYYLYNKAAIKELARELNARNLDLNRYIEYKKSEAEFQKKLATVKQKKLPTYLLPDDARDVSTSPLPVPDLELIKKDLEFLKAEFTYHNLSEYVDIYKGNYAMLKTMYYFEKYIEKAVKKRCLKWCDSFNYANHAFTLITNKKDTFEGVREEDKIEL